MTDSTTKVVHGKALLEHFLLDSKYLNINHGSFGTYPRQVQSRYNQLHAFGEARPDIYVRYTSLHLKDQVRTQLASLLHPPNGAHDLVFVPNTTTGTNTVLRNLVAVQRQKQSASMVVYYFEILIHAAAERTLRFLADANPGLFLLRPIKVVKGEKEVEDELEHDNIVHCLQNAIHQDSHLSYANTVRLAMFDTVVSMPGIRLPFERLAALCRRENVLSLVDGAHSVGMLPWAELNLTKLGIDFFVANLNKWLYVPRGCGLLYVAPQHQPLIRSTLPTSFGYLSPTNPQKPQQHSPQFTDSSKTAFERNFENVGATDPASYLCVTAALHFRHAQLGGEPALLAYMHELAQRGGARVAERLGTRVLDTRGGSLGRHCAFVNVRLPLCIRRLLLLAGASGAEEQDAVALRVKDWLTALVVREYDSFFTVFWLAGAWWVRLSAQVYLDLDDFERAAEILVAVCKRAGDGEFMTATPAKL